MGIEIVSNIKKLLFELGNIIQETEYNVNVIDQVQLQKITKHKWAAGHRQTFIGSMKETTCMLHTVVLLPTE